MPSEARLGCARLMAITDIARFGTENTLKRVQSLCRAASPGTVLVQLRDRGLPVRERLAIGERLASLARESEQGFLVNDRLDLALALRADGVHLGEGSVTAGDARQLLGEGAVVSRACHELDQLDDAKLGAVDAVVLSPVFAARKGQPALGVQVLGEAARRLATHGRRPRLFALGGVDAKNAPELSETGSAAAAVGAVFEADPTELIAALGIAR